MLSSLRNMFRVPDLRNKILFTLLIIALYRLGAYIPAPGIDLDAVAGARSARPRAGGGVLGFLQLFSGGALTQFAIFALGIMPYITASIIMQILTVVIPKLEEWQQQGAVGQRKITQWTRYLDGRHRARCSPPAWRSCSTTAAAACSAAAATPPASTCCPNFTAAPGAAGRAHAHRRHRPADVDGRAHHPARHRQRHVAADLLLGGQSSIPAQFAQLKAEKGTVPVRRRCSCSRSLLLVGIVFVEQGQRRIPVQFAKRVVGRRMYGGQSTYIPLKVNQAGVIPIIFASSVLYLPVLLSQRAARPTAAGASTCSAGSNDNLVQPDVALSTSSSTAC